MISAHIFTVMVSKDCNGASRISQTGWGRGTNLLFDQFSPKLHENEKFVPRGEGYMPPSSSQIRQRKGRNNKEPQGTTFFSFCGVFFQKYREVLYPPVRNMEEIFYRNISRGRIHQQSTYILLLFCKSNLRRWTFFVNKLIHV